MKMNATTFWIAGLVVLGVLLLALLQAAPEPVDWTPSYESDETRPYASTVVREALPSLFLSASVETVNRPPYLQLRRDTTRGGAYLFVTRTFAPDPVETEALIAYAARGNTVLVAAQSFGPPWQDTLGVETERRFGNFKVSGSTDTTSVLALDALDASISFPRGDVDNYVFAAYDTSRTQVLGRAVFQAQRAPTLLRTTVGEGAVVMSSTPNAFTNAHALNPDTDRYVWAALSTLPASTAPVWWDAHHKPAATEASSPLRFVGSEPALRRAYGVVLLGVVLFMTLMARRRQRIVPDIEPPKNETVTFVRTVGRLAHREGSAGDVAEQRITYWLASLRRRLGVRTDVLDDDWIERVALWTGVSEDDLRDVVRIVQIIRSARSQEGRRVSDQQLRTLNARIESVEAQSAR